MKQDRSRGSAWWEGRWGKRAAELEAKRSLKASRRKPGVGVVAAPSLKPAFPPGGLKWDDAIEETWWRCERTRFPMVPA